MSDQSTYNALNGKEVRDLLFIHLRNKIDKLPMLSVGNSFHQLKMLGAVELTAFPDDVKLPEVEFEILIPDVVPSEFNEHFKKINDLMEYREKLLAKLQEIDLIVDKAVPEEVVEVNIGGPTPDDVRAEHGLPVPVLKSVSETGRKAEVNVPATIYLRK